MKIGLVLSGGGARGIAHLGAFKALNEIGLEVHAVAGTSAGAIAGALFCEGFEAEEMLGIIRETNVFAYLRPSFSSTGLISMEKTEQVFLKYLPHNSFEKLKKKLFINATDIRTGRSIFFSKGELITPLLASASIPIIFAPVSYQGYTLVDGGVVNNFPVEPLLEQCEFLIGVHCNTINENIRINTFRRIVERSFDLAVLGNTVDKFAKVNLLIEDKGFGKYGIFDKKAATTLFRLGYQATLKHHKQLIELASSNTAV